MAIPKVENTDRLDMQLWFLDREAKGEWAALPRLRARGRGDRPREVVFASPWLPTVIGTDRYTDQLW